MNAHTLLTRFRVAISSSFAVDPQAQAPIGRSLGAKSARVAVTFVLRDYQDSPIYPVRSRKGTFTLAPRGANMHLAVHAIHVRDEEEAFRLVTSGTYRIRAVRAGDRAPSLLSVGDRSVKTAERIKP